MADHGNDIAHVWEKIESIGICILITEDGGKPRARPMGAYVRQTDNAIFLFTNKGTEKADEVADHPEICLMFKGSGESYVSINGTARISNDRDKIRELWTVIAKAWWSGPDDPEIRLMRVTPHEAEIWDSPGRIVSYVAMVAAAVTGAKPAVGENFKVKM